MSNFNEPHYDRQGHPENLEFIDFKCSEYWSNYFYEAGYSRYKPPSPKRRASVVEEKLRRDFGHLATEVSGLHAKHEVLTRKFEALSKGVEALKIPSPTISNGKSTGVPVEDLE
jgi:hypothetical protein